MNYWLDLFTPTTWKEFQDAGAKVSGFRETRRAYAQKIEVGDLLLCYVTGISRFVGVLTVTSKLFEDKTPIWQSGSFPCRLKVKVLHILNLETAVPVYDLRGKLSFWGPEVWGGAWTGHFRGSPSKWKHSDGEVVLNYVKDAVANPKVVPVDPIKLKYMPKTVAAKIGDVTIPGLDDNEKDDFTEDELSSSEHTEVQFLLLQLGAEMGFSVWVAKNDRHRSYKGQKFTELPSLRAELPLQFDEATNSTIRLIGVLWLKHNAIVAAFEIESTTSVYSGLLRMSDLLAMQPNLNIPLYLAAPEQRRSKVMTEVNRPTFSKSTPPVSEVCRYISFSIFKQHLERVKGFTKYLKPEFLDELSDSCSLA